MRSYLFPAIAAGLIVASSLATAKVRQGYEFEVVEPSVPLESLPMDLAGLTGEDAAIPEDVKDTINSAAFVNRVYSNDTTQIGVFGVYWSKPSELEARAPHHPLICYPNAGWKVLENRKLDLTVQDGTFPVMEMLVSRGEQRAVVWYWYQMGEEVFHDGIGGDAAFRKFWGTGKWPVMSKFLIQSAAGDLETGRAILTAPATAVAEWALQSRK